MCLQRFVLCNGVTLVDDTCVIAPTSTMAKGDNKVEEGLVQNLVVFGVN